MNRRAAKKRDARGRNKMVSPLLKTVALAAAARAFLLPGIAPHDYQPGERVWLKVNSLTSSKTQVPYDMLLVALGVALVAGAAGFLASLKFLAYIFAQIKFD